MLIRKSPEFRYSQITPQPAYLNRRRFLAAGSVALSALSALHTATAGAKLAATKSKFSTTEQPTPFDAITHYNNFYEFGTDKEDPSKNAYKLRTSPWSVKIEGAVAKPQVLDMNAILKIAPLEERIYRHRCVEAWSMVIPWIGFPVSAILKQVEPTAKAKFVAFESFYDSKYMLGTFEAGIRFPYIEGLRMDEAMHPLALLAVGLYGETLPNQDGAPFRLVVPWKYGFKSIKSIVKIRVVEREPPTTWSIQNPSWYGFYSNVNPEVNPVRWDQSKERRIGEFRMRQTIKFNGYGEQVAGLYSGMDLRKYY